MACVRLADSRLAQIYAAKGAYVSSTQASSLIKTFEDHIYPTNTRVFGHPQHLGKVTIILAPLDGLTLGYFDENDLLRRDDLSSDQQHSNHGNVLYVRSPRTMPDADQMAETKEAIAHEFQHLLNYRVRVIDHHFAAQDDWLNEGMSFYAQIANGYWTYRDVLKVRAAALAPSWPVTLLSHSTAFLRKYARVAYGRAGLFVSYLAARFGEGILHTVLADKHGDMRAVESALATMTPRASLNSVFADWGVASYLGRKGTYGYGSLRQSLRVSPSWSVPPVSSYPFDTATGGHNLSLKPWSQSYVRFSVSRVADLRLSLTGPAGRLAVAGILQDPTGAVATKIQWLKFTLSGRATWTVSGFGGFYSQMTLAMTDTGSTRSKGGGGADSIRVSASLVHVRDNN